MDHFNITQVFGIHNAPDARQGTFHTNKGALMAAANTVYIQINGSGDHVAQPEDTRDPLIAGVALVQAFLTIQSRNLGGLNRAVISLGAFVSGTANNFIPGSASISGTVRAFETDIQAQVAARMKAICEGIATSFDVAVDMIYEYGYPPTVNDPEKALLAA